MESADAINHQEGFERDQMPLLLSLMKKFQQELSDIKESLPVKRPTPGSGTSTPKRAPQEEIEEQLLNTRLFGSRPSKRESREVGMDSEDSDPDESRSSSSNGSDDDRRASMLKPLTSKKASPLTAVSIYSDQPSYSHISLKYLGINEVFKFWTEINKYQQMHGIELKATTLISDDCRRRIMSKCDIKSELKFFKLPQKRLRKYIQKSVRPTDKNMFARMLASSLKFWEGKETFVLGVANFHTFYDRLLTYRQEFKDKFEFLAYHNGDNVPKLENKDGGTIKIFLLQLPSDYAMRSFAQLPKSRFDDLDEFLIAFYKLAKEHYQIAVESKKLNSFLPSNKPVTPSAPRREDNRARFVSKVHQVNEEFEENGSMESEEISRILPDSQKTSFELQLEEHELEKEELNEQFTTDLNAFGGGMHRAPLRAPPKPPDRPVARGPNGCFRSLTEGKCSKPNCSFDHSESVLDATLEDLLAKLQKKLYKAKPIRGIDMAGYKAPDGET